jgi:hypothetical protein
MIESLEVRWPSGKVETFKNLAADRFYALLEGEGCRSSRADSAGLARTARQVNRMPREL